MTGESEAVSLLRELLAWQKAATIPTVRQTVDKALTSPPQRRAYDLANGTLSVRELAKRAGASPAAVGKWSKRWRQLGIASVSADGSVMHLGTLDSFGLTIEPSDGAASAGGGD